MLVRTTRACSWISTFSCPWKTSFLTFFQEACVRGSAARREDCRPILWAVRDRSSPCPASRSRGPHHGHDLSPNGIGQAAPDGGQVGHRRRDRLGLHEAPQSLGLAAGAPAMDGTASPSPAAVIEMTSVRGAAALTCDHQTSRPSTIARIRRRSSSVSESHWSTTCSRVAGSGPQSAPPGSGIEVFPGKKLGGSSPSRANFSALQQCVIPGGTVSAHHNHSCMP